MRVWHLGILIWLFSGSVLAVMQNETISYRDGEVELKGQMFWDDAFSGKRAGILVLHERWGLNDYAKLRAEMLAESGYVAFAADLYGAGKKTRDAEEAALWMGQITGDEALWQRRVNLALDQLKSHPKVEAEKLAAIGFGYGGASVMELVYSGAILNGIVSFHGPMLSPTQDQAKRVKARVLLARGGADPFVSFDRVEAFQKALSAAGVDWEMNTYGQAQHSFTNPYADGYGVTGLAYQEEADRRSWLRMLAFFEELFEPDL
jgi:dienelactone hydrolase